MSRLRDRCIRSRPAPVWMLAAALIAVACGDSSEPAQVDGSRMRLIRPPTQDQGLQGVDEQTAEELTLLGYLGTGNAISPDAVITVSEPGASQGYGFYTSGHAAEAFLVDKAGNPLHRWRMPSQRAFPDTPPVHPTHRYLRRAHLYENGDVVTFYSDAVDGLFKMDRDSKVVWTNARIRPHHDIHVLPTGEIYVLTRYPRIVKAIDPGTRILEDFISVLDAAGRELRSVSLLRALKRSEYWNVWLEHAKECEGKYATEVDCLDIFHTNSLKVLDGRFAQLNSAFRAGNVLVSFRHLNSIAVVDLDAVKVVWLHSGSYRAQHDPRFTEDGNILLFDNRGLGEASSVLEIDPVSGDTIWEYRGSETQPFYSLWCGTAERLSNGNTFITESENGRAFEVTSQGEIVWEFYNPNRAGEHGEYIGVLFEMVHLPPSFPVDWAENAAASVPATASTD